jgi:hypothetical protein
VLQPSEGRRWRQLEAGVVDAGMLGEIQHRLRQGVREVLHESLIEWVRATQIDAAADARH